GIWRDTCVFKLPDEEGARFMANEGAIPFAPMKDRVMKGWYEAPEAVSHDAEQLTTWCAKAAAYVRGLPPKRPKKPPAARTAEARKQAHNVKKAQGKKIKKAPRRSRPR